MPECSNIRFPKGSLFRHGLRKLMREMRFICLSAEKANVVFLIVYQFKRACFVGSGPMMNFYTVTEEISRCLTRIFLRNKGSRSPVYGASKKFQKERLWVITT
jgi:hypothetical protein